MTPAKLLDGFLFEAFWRTGAWSKHGRAEAEKRFLAQIKTEADWHDIQAARDAYNRHMAQNKWRSPMQGATWFGKIKGWREWIPDEVEAACDDKEPLLQFDVILGHKCELCEVPHSFQCDDCKDGACFGPVRMPCRTFLASLKGGR